MDRVSQALQQLNLEASDAAKHLRMSNRDESDTLYKLSFLGEWYDYDSALEKHFIINFYPSDETIELFDIDLNRIFLRRTTCLGVSSADIFIGNSVLIFGRQIKITDYADCRTKKLVGKGSEHTFTMIKPSAMDKIGQTIERLEEEQFQIINIKMVILTEQQALEFFAFRQGDHILPFMIDHVSSAPILVMEFIGYNAIARWYNEVLGPSDPAEARKTNPGSLRAIYGKELITNGYHGPQDPDRVKFSVDFFFNKGKELTPKLQLSNTTCAIIKPHVLQDRNCGRIIIDIMESKFKILALKSFHLTKLDVEEFLEIYKGVVSDYNALVLSFVNGPCIVMEIGGKTPDMQDVHGEFRKFCGPPDPDIGRQIRPSTLRARYGVDKYKNAIHCTDLPDDTTLDLEYFFKILT